MCTSKCKRSLKGPSVFLCFAALGQLKTFALVLLWGYQGRQLQLMDIIWKDINSPTVRGEWPCVHMCQCT